MNAEMNAFESVIGYDAVKQQLTEVLDIVHNPQVYERFGVSCPKGILLYGAPGVGKTLIANSFIAASGRDSVVCRKTSPQQSFVDLINEVFDKALACSPSVILLDDMDKFANDDEYHKDSEAYVTIQSCIDLVKDEDVLVVATANNIRKLPDSLIRSGRFDRKIHVLKPNTEEAKAIISHYLEDKDLGDQVDIEAVATLFAGHECSTLESAINQAGILAGYRRAKCISMQDLIKAYLIIAHSIPKEHLISTKSKNLFASDGSMDVFWHEAGHVVIGELLSPGSVSIAIAVGNDEFEKGFTKNSIDSANMNKLSKLKSHILMSFGAAAATDITFGRVDLGARYDIQKALKTISDVIEDLGGFSGLSLACHDCSSFNLDQRREDANSAIAELYYQEAKEMLCQNRPFLEAIARALAEQSVLTAKDIAEIHASVEQDKVLYVEAA
ncbi:AAA family ATPase [Anaerotardibacter muris]|uniref:AAA family ATPase n=1 Tax=Anaerotardibacter muris TaxID=2941505 RepID=UPI0020402B76|nr:AAA family ATPase [Anaerotardibacter muris]